MLNQTSIPLMSPLHAFLPQTLLAPRHADHPGGGRTDGLLHSLYSSACPERAVARRAAGVRLSHRPPGRGGAPARSVFVLTALALAGSLPADGVLLSGTAGCWHPLTGWRCHSGSSSALASSSFHQPPHCHRHCRTSGSVCPSETLAGDLAKQCRAVFLSCLR